MNIEIRKNLFELEEKLNKINLHYDDPIDRCDQSIDEVVFHLKQLKAYILENSFENREEEIYFFKKVKPKFTSKLIFFKKVKKLEVRKPVGSKKSLTNYFKKELEKLNFAFEENLVFYDYYRLNNDFLDNKLFVRDVQEVCPNIDPIFFELDPRFSTSHDHLVANILANDLLQHYIENKISVLNGDVIETILPEFMPRLLKWTGSKSDLIELIYALHEKKVFNDGEADIRDIARSFEKILDIDLGDIYRGFNDIKKRKTGESRFLESLVEAFMRRFKKRK
ncbi:MAG: RteC domain-containing protein [Flavobacterium sp.]